MMSIAPVVPWVCIPCGLRTSSYNVREHRVGDVCFRSPATGGARWTSSQDFFAAARAQRTWKAGAYGWRHGPAAMKYINI